MEKTDARKLTTEQQQLLRNHAIVLRKKGFTYKEISEITGVHFTTICTWWKIYEREGQKGIEIKKRGREPGSGRSLSPDREKEIRTKIRDGKPDELGLPFALWTRRAVRDFIRSLYSFEMPIRTVGEYLKRWDYTPQKPLKKAYRQKPEAVRKWIDEEYPAIRKKAKAENGEIHWCDETGLCNTGYHGRGYAPKGRTPEISVHPRCERVNLVSTVTNQGKIRFMLYDGKMNADTLVRFTKRLIKDTDRKVFLILDNLKVHHSHVVRDWAEEHSEKIELFFCPRIHPN
ncbi:IS630 family transposase [Desulfonema ishimotonii]|uniref:Transposase n=1 Tax=Desulfonema ishimotonii TaxID=45657 RepID=A0A401FUB5_9BACT|nr:transposase [Desulfonema ishimotonii]GBC59380.1 transposase [Desulfonema ishimotonii]GBC59747.1 IS630 family transposase [Desulfonema ishimotonii]GBC59849.1 IS630 family transposase [Desulfonema ishimotonii]GBC59940.1 IS630 family transposase [Desulfonema ishimotonii]